MDPGLAKGLAEKGFSKADVIQWLFNQARVPFSKFTPEDIANYKEYLEKSKRMPLPWWIEGSFRGMDPSLAAVNSPDHIILVVAGGEPGYSTVWCYPTYFSGRGTKLIHGATLTNAGR